VAGRRDLGETTRSTAGVEQPLAAQLSLGPTSFGIEPIA
jgi:hypothetical protein